jgi:hypothetical protein
MRPFKPVNRLSHSKTMETICLRAFSIVSITRHVVRLLLPTDRNCLSDSRQTDKQTRTRATSPTDRIRREKAGACAGGDVCIAWPMGPACHERDALVDLLDC